MQIVSGEIAEDITNYFATSEQIPTVCALGVLVNPDLTIRKAGGFIIQLLPTADDTIIDKVEKCISDIEPVTTMLDKGLSPETICRTVLPASSSTCSTPRSRNTAATARASASPAR